MTKVQIKYHNKLISKIIVNGHALFADHGQDIVCASISTLTIHTYNLLKRFSIETVLETDEARIAFSVSEKMTAQLICDQFVASLEEIQEQYKEHVSIEKNGGE